MSYCAHCGTHTALDRDARAYAGWTMLFGLYHPDDDTLIGYGVALCAECSPEVKVTRVEQEALFGAT